MDPTTQAVERTGRLRWWRRWLNRGGLSLVGILLVSQAVPFGRGHSNPPVTAEPGVGQPDHPSDGADVLR